MTALPAHSLTNVVYNFARSFGVLVRWSGPRGCGVRQVGCSARGRFECGGAACRTQSNVWRPILKPSRGMSAIGSIVIGGKRGSGTSVEIRPLVPAASRCWSDRIGDHGPRHAGAARTDELAISRG